MVGMGDRVLARAPVDDRDDRGPVGLDAGRVGEELAHHLVAAVGDEQGPVAGAQGEAVVRDDVTLLRLEVEAPGERIIRVGVAALAGPAPGDAPECFLPLPSRPPRPVGYLVPVHKWPIFPIPGFLRIRHILLPMEH